MNHQTADWKRIGMTAALGAGAAVLAAGLFLCLFALLLTVGVPDGWIPAFAHLTAILSAFAAGFAAGKKWGHGGLKIGLIAGAALFAVHTALILCGSWTAGTLTFLPAELLGGALGGILSVNL